MPPPSDSPNLHLSLLSETYYVFQLPANEPLPKRLLNLIAANPENTDFAPGHFLSITRTHEEFSVVTDTWDALIAAIPPQKYPTNDSDELLLPEHTMWACVKVKGPMVFELTGIMSELTSPLARAGVPVFALSTWNTDWLLVPKGKSEEAVLALQGDGWTVTRPQSD